MLLRVRTLNTSWFLADAGRRHWVPACAGMTPIGASAVAGLEILHEIDERADALDRHRVVDRRAHAADRAMALEREQARLLRFGEECLVERFVAQAERDVHARARAFLDRVRIEPRAVDRVVEQRGLFGADAAHRLDPAVFLHPLEDERREVPPERVRRVEERALLRVRGVVEYPRQRLRAALEQVVA